MPPIDVHRDGPLAILELDHPPLNLFDNDVIDGFETAVADLVQSPPRALLLRAVGRVTSAGVDVHVFDGLSPEAAASLWRRLLACIHALEELPLPTVFAAHSLCLTAVFEIALACDLLLAAQSASFGLIERTVGLTPAMGGTQRLVERAGPARARQLVMSGRRYDATTLERWNVVNEVLPDEGFADAAEAFARELANGPTKAHAATKAIVAAAVGGGARAADEIVPETAGALFGTDDLRGAVSSFLTHGPEHTPSFEGR